MAKARKRKTLTHVLHEKAKTVGYWHIFLVLLIFFGYFVIGYLLGYKLRFSP